MSQPPSIDYCEHALSGNAPHGCGFVQNQPKLDKAGNATGKTYKWCFLCDIDEAKADREQRLAAKEKGEDKP